MPSHFPFCWYLTQPKWWNTPVPSTLTGSPKLTATGTPSYRTSGIGLDLGRKGNPVHSNKVMAGRFEPSNSTAGS